VRPNSPGWQAGSRSRLSSSWRSLPQTPTGQQAPESKGGKRRTNPLLLTTVLAAQSVDHPLRVSGALGLSVSLTGSAPESESGALIDGLFPPSPHRWPNQPWTAPEVPGGNVDSKLLAGRYLWFKRSLAARTDSGCESSLPGRVSDGAGRSNLCPQLCPVVGTGP
jgi:hypothetical protein